MLTSKLLAALTTALGRRIIVQFRDTAENTVLGMI